jgi:hypothetical protein
MARSLLKKSGIEDGAMETTLEQKDFRAATDHCHAYPE